MPVRLTKYMSKITRQAPTHMHEIYAQYAKGNVTDTLHFNVYASACLFQHCFSFYCAHSLNDTSFSFSKGKKKEKKKKRSTAYHNNNNAHVSVTSLFLAPLLDQQMGSWPLFTNIQCTFSFLRTITLVS